jgi:hypothetical protein
MAEPELEILDLVASIFGEDSSENLNIIEFKRLVEELLN